MTRATRSETGRPFPAAASRALVVAGMGCGSVGLVLGGVLWGGVAGVREPWFGADAPLGLTHVGLRANELLVVAAQLVLLGSWLGVGLLVERGLAGVRTAVASTVAAGVPLLAGAPLFSNDAYTYIAVGRLLDRGLDPYRVGWAALHDASYDGHVDLTWAHSTSPYSPMVLRLLQLDAHATGGRLLAGVVVLRVAAALAFSTLGFAVAAAARRRGSVALSDRAGRGGEREDRIPAPGRSVALALWISVGNPVLSEHLLSGLHVDLYVTVLLVLAVTAHLGGHRIGAVLLVVLAAQVKVTAAVVLLVLVADTLRAGTTPAGVLPPDTRPAAAQAGDRRVVWARAGLHLGIAVAAFCAASVESGLGFGWTRGLRTSALGRNQLTPVNALSDLARRAGLLATPSPGAAAVAAVGVAAAAGVLAVAVIGWSVWRVRRLGVPLAAAAAMAALSGLGTATWPWYFAPVLALVAISGAPRRVLGVAAAASVALAVALKPGSGPAIPHLPVVADAATLVLLAGVVAALLLLRSSPEAGRTNAD